MKSLISKTHYFIIIYLLVGVYSNWVENKEKIESELDQVPVMKNKIARAKKEKKQLKTYLKDVESAKGRIELVASEIEKLQKKFPDVIDDTKNLSTLKKMAEQINIKNVYLTPMGETTKDFFIAKKYNFKASGTYLQFLLLMEKIGAESTILNIKRIFLENVQKKQRGRFQIINGDIIIETYRYNKNYKEDRGISGIENDFVNKSKNKKRKKNKPRKRKKR